MKRFIFLILLSLLLSYLTGCSQNKEFPDGTIGSLMDYDPNFFSVFLGDAKGGNPEAQDALRLCAPILYSLLMEDYASKKQDHPNLLEPIDNMMIHFYRTGSLPRDPYPEIGEYCTSMDAPLLAVTSEVAYETTGDNKYRQYVLDLIDYCTKSTDEGGFLLKINDEEWWPLEYAWKGITEDNAWFVYNGSLFGSVCTEMLFQLTGDKRLEEILQKSLNAYKVRSKQFYYEDNSWCYYSLNSIDGNKVINRSDKLFIEIKSLYVLYLLTNEPFYYEEYNNRIALFSGLYPLYIERGELDDTIYFLRSGAPHPYYVDIYPNIIEVYNKQGDLLHTESVAERTPDEAALIFSVPQGAHTYKLYIKSIPDPFLVTESQFKTIDASQLSPTLMSGVWSCAFNSDAQIENGNEVTLNPNASEKNKGELYYEFAKEVKQGKEVYLVVEYINNSTESIPVGGVLYNNDGSTFVRTLTACTPGKGLFILHYAGFKNLSFPLPNLTMLGLSFSTNSFESDSAQIIFPAIFLFDNTAALAKFLHTPPHQFLDFWVYR